MGVYEGNHLGPRHSPYVLDELELEDRGHPARAEPPRETHEDWLFEWTWVREWPGPGHLPASRWGWYATLADTRLEATRRISKEEGVCLGSKPGNS